MIDATIVRAHQHSAGARKKGVSIKPSAGSRGGLTTKIHVIVDTLGNPLALSGSSGGQVHDHARKPTRCWHFVEPEALLADKGYDADHFVERLTARAITVVISPQITSESIKRDCGFRAQAANATSSSASSDDQAFSSNGNALREDRAKFSAAFIWFAPSLGSNDDSH